MGRFDNLLNSLDAGTTSRFSGLLDAVDAQDSEQDWEDTASPILQRNRRTGATRPKPIPGAEPGLGRVDTSDRPVEGLGRKLLYGPTATEKGVARDKAAVADLAWGPFVAGAERLGLIPEGTRHELRQAHQDAEDAYLLAHPEGGLGRAVVDAARTAVSGLAGPQLALGAGAGGLAARGALAAGAGEGLGVVAGVAGGAAEGAGLGYVDAVDLSPDERRLQTALGGALGGLGGVSAARAAARTALAHEPPPLPAPEVVQALEAEAANLAQTPGLDLSTLPEWHAVRAKLAQAAAAGDERAGAILDQTQETVVPRAEAPAIEAPLDPTYQEAERFAEFLRSKGIADEDAYYALPKAKKLVLDAQYEILSPREMTGSASAEGGFIRNPFAKRQTPSAQVQPDPFDALMPPTTPEPNRTPLERLQSAQDRVTDEFFNQEDAPVRRLRRAGQAQAADALEGLFAKARGAGAWMRDLIREGTYVFDEPTQQMRRTGDGLQAVLGGTDKQVAQDLEHYMASRRHMELANRQERASLEYDWNRAQRLEGLRQARRSDKESLRAMFGDIRTARANELKAVRGLSQAELETRLRESFYRAEQGRAGDLANRAGRANEQALDAAEGSRSAGAELDASTVEAQWAALYARQLLRSELRNATRQARRGETHGLTRGVAPRSPAAVQEADVMGLALRRVAERVGVEEGRLTELLAREGELQTLGRQAGRSAGAQGERAAQAWGRLGQGAQDAASTRAQTNQSLRSAQRVAMGIRDDATRRVPKVDRPPDIDLTIDPDATAEVRNKLAQLSQRYGAAPDGSGAIPRLDQLAHGVQDWSIRSVLIPLKEAGRLSDREFSWAVNSDGTLAYSGDILAKNQDFAPFFRIMDVLGADPEILTGTTKSNPIHSISGGLSAKRPIAPVLESFVEQAQKANIWAERQRTRNYLARVVDADPALQNDIKLLPPTTGQNDLPLHVRGTFPAWENGSRRLYAAPEDVIQAFERLTPKQAALGAQLAGLAVRALRVGTTATLEFAARNPLRDVQDALVFGKGYRPWDFVAGLFDLLGDQRWAKQWRVNGGGLSDIVSYAQPDLRASIEDAMAKPGARILPTIAARWRSENWLGKVAFPLLAPLEAAAGVLERSTKVGGYRRGILQGKTPLSAAVASRDIGSPDFARGGRSAKWISGNLEAFFNPELQGLYRFGRAMRRDPVSTTIKAFAYLTVPAVVHWLRWRNDEEHQALKSWERVGFYQIAKRDDGSFWEVPRSPGAPSVIFGVGVESMLDRMAQEDPNAASRFIGALVDQTPAHYIPWLPGGRKSFDVVPSIAQPAVEAVAGEGGWSSFQQGPIVPRPLQDVLPEDRSMDRTTETARAIGNATGTAPLKIDYLIRGYLGRWGRMMTSAVDAAIPGQPTGAPAPLPTTARDIPLVRGFVSQPAIGVGSQPVSDLYRFATDAAQAKLSLKEARDNNDIERYQAIVRDHPELAVHDRLQDTRKELNDLRKDRNEVAHNPALTPEQRQDLLIAYDYRIMQYAAVEMKIVSRVLANYDNRD